MRCAVPFHDGVDGSGHDISGSQVAQRVEVLHERPQGYVAQDGPLAADGFGDEGTASVGSLERRWMELDHFHVAYFGSRTIGHRDTIAGCDIGVGRELIDLAGTTGSQDDGIGGKRLDASGLRVEHMQPENTVFGGADRTGAELGAGDEVDCEMMFEHHHLR